MDMTLHIKYKSLLDKGGINTPLRLAHFFAQVAHESDLSPKSENLNYSEKGLLLTFKKYFPNSASTKGYTRNAIKIANKVYANRMSNGNEASGDGWKYRGRGFIQLTGKQNYQLLTKATGVDYVNKPDLLLSEADAMIAAIWYWNSNNLNKHADRDDIDTVSDIVNLGRSTEAYGDSIGFKDRLAKLKNFKIQFKVK